MCLIEAKWLRKDGSVSVFTAKSPMHPPFLAEAKTKIVCLLAVSCDGYFSL